MPTTSSGIRARRRSAGSETPGGFCEPQRAFEILTSLGGIPTTQESRDDLGLFGTVFQCRLVASGRPEASTFLDVLRPPLRQELREQRLEFRSDSRVLPLKFLHLRRIGFLQLGIGGIERRFEFVLLFRRELVIFAIEDDATALHQKIRREHPVIVNRKSNERSCITAPEPV